MPTLRTVITAPAPAPVAMGRPKVYDFTAIPIDARFGYTATTQPRASYARDPEAIRSEIARGAVSTASR